MAHIRKISVSKAMTAGDKQTLDLDYLLSQMILAVFYWILGEFIGAK